MVGWLEGRVGGWVGEGKDGEILAERTRGGKRGCAAGEGVVEWRAFFHPTRFSMFQGTYTALVTPFNRDGSVDFGCLRAIVDQQAAAARSPPMDERGRLARNGPRI